MKNKTCEDTAKSIVKAGGGSALIVSALRAVFGQGYNRGYLAKVLDIKKAAASKNKAMSRAFKMELDQIEDVRIAKWE